MAMKNVLLLTALVVGMSQISLGNVNTPIGDIPNLKLPDEGKAEAYRLPEGIKPASYKLKVIPLLKEGNFSFSGEVSINVTVLKENLTSITLHVKDLNITDQVVEDKAGSKVGINSSLPGTGDFYVITLKDKLKKNDFYTIKMKFSGPLNEDLTGLYRSSYINADGKTEWMAVTQFEPTSARKAFPCFDEPHLKATFEVSIARPKDMNTLCNMNTRSTAVNSSDPSLPESYVWDVYEETPLMSTYLVAFTVSKFISVSVGGNVTVWAHENVIDQVHYSAEEAPKLIQIMNNLTGVDYELPKMDLIGIPDFAAGAMENWGLVTFREVDLLYEKVNSPASSRQRVATVIAHEFAHQWFGDLVTPEWWKFVWLSEGFATYFMYTATNELNPDWRLTQQFVVDQLQTGLLSDSMARTHAMTYDVNPSDIYVIFDNIAYNKAGSVIRMMEHILGRETFFKGLNKYLKARNHNSANEDQLFEQLDAQAKIDNVTALQGGLTMKEIMKSWTNQAGYPVITVKRDYLQGEATIKQERFMSEKINSTETATWWIPITRTTETLPNFENTKPVIWMKQGQKEITIDGLPTGEKWIIFNLQQMGFFRVNYDTKNWILLAIFLNTGNYSDIHPLNRAQLISDSLNLARTGLLNYTTALTLTSYLKRETDFIPWASVYKPFDFIYTHISNETVLEKYKFHIQQLVKARYDTVKFNESSDDDPLLSLSRSQLLPWACKHNYSECVSTAAQLFADFVNGTEVSANLKSTVYCYGIASGTSEDWDFLWKQYNTTKVASEKTLILKALACSTEESTLKQYLEKIITSGSGIRAQDGIIVLEEVIQSNNGLDVALDFFIENFNTKLLEIYPMNQLISEVILLANRISSDEQSNKLKSFMKKNSEILGKEVQNAINILDATMEWNAQYLSEIESWLDGRYPSSSSINHASLIFILLMIFLKSCF